MGVSVLFTRDDGKKLELNGSGFGVISVEGFGPAGREIFTEKRAVGHGEIITGTRMAGRNITVKAQRRHHQGNAESRERIRLFFTYAHTYDITLEYDKINASATGCTVKAISLPTESVYAPQELAVTLYSPIPYLRSGGMNGTNINTSSGGFFFPYGGYAWDENDARVPVCWSYYDFGEPVQFYNDGICSTWAKCVMTANGHVENPRFIHGTKYVGIKKAMENGDVLEIDTEARTVKLNGKNAQKWLDSKSSFAGMELKPGENTLSFAAASGDSNLDVQLYYYKLVEGI